MNVIYAFINGLRTAQSLQTEMCFLRGLFFPSSHMLTGLFSQGCSGTLENYLDLEQGPSFCFVFLRCLAHGVPGLCLVCVGTSTIQINKIILHTDLLLLSCSQAPDSAYWFRTVCSYKQAEQCSLSLRGCSEGELIDFWIIFIICIQKMILEIFVSHHHHVRVHMQNALHFANRLKKCKQLLPTQMRLEELTQLSSNSPIGLLLRGRKGPISCTDVQRLQRRSACLSDSLHFG